MFYNATSFNSDLSAWDTSGVTNMWGMFGGASSFDRSLAAWDVSNVTNMQWMFGDADGQAYTTSGLSTANYDATLIGWSSQALQDNVTFDAGTSTYCAAEVQRQSIITNFSWTINDSGKDCDEQRPFIIKIDTRLGDEETTEFTVPANTYAYTYSYSLDCNNDGVIDYENLTDVQVCTYSSAG
jgi:surface protein